MKPTRLHIIKISKETFFLATCSKVFKSSPDDRDQGGKYDFLFYTEFSYFGEDNRTSKSKFFFYISLDACMAMAGAALVW